MARGGITVGAAIPDLQEATAQQIAEAVRMGPYLMPHFDSKQINQYQLDSLARYVLWTRHPDNAGGWGIYNIGPIPEGIVAWFIGLLALVIVARLIGETRPEVRSSTNQHGRTPSACRRCCVRASPAWRALRRARPSRRAPAHPPVSEDEDNASPS